jgi:mRNA interferase MazF
VAKPVAGDIVVLPFPQTNLQAGKRRPALVVADLPGDDLVLCQITSQSHRDSYSVLLDVSDFQTGQLAVRSYIWPNRLFTADDSVIAYVAARVTKSKA